MAPRREEPKGPAALPRQPRAEPPHPSHPDRPPRESSSAPDTSEGGSGGRRRVARTAAPLAQFRVAELVAVPGGEVAEGRTYYTVLLTDPEGTDRDAGGRLTLVVPEGGAPLAQGDVVGLAVQTSGEAPPPADDSGDD